MAVGAVAVPCFAVAAVLGRQRIGLRDDGLELLRERARAVVVGLRRERSASTSGLASAAWFCAYATARVSNFTRDVVAGVDRGECLLRVVELAVAHATSASASAIERTSSLSSFAAAFALSR